MKKIVSFALTLVAMMGIHQAAAQGFQLPNMQVTSKAFATGEVIPIKYTSHGDNIQPDFTITGAPDNTVSYAIIMHDIEVALGGGGKDGPVYIRPDAALMGGLAVLLCQPLAVVLPTSAWVLNDGNGELSAEPVGHLPHPGIVGRRIVELIAVCVGHGIDHKMIVIMPGVAVGGHDHLKSVAPQFFRKAHPDLMGGFRRDLICLERLIPVVADPAIQLAPQTLGFHELRCGVGLRAVQAGHIGTVFCFHIVGSVFHHAVNGVQRRQFAMPALGGFLRVPSVVYDLIHTPFNGPDGGDSHQLSAMV